VIACNPVLRANGVPAGSLDLVVAIERIRVSLTAQPFAVEGRQQRRRWRRWSAAVESSSDACRSRALARRSPRRRGIDSRSPVKTC